jgi:phosphoglycolate phosphatase
MDAYLFDLDGTLIDSRDDIAHSANFARTAVGLPALRLEEIYRYIGEGAQRLIERAVGPEHADRWPEALERWREHYAVHMLDRTKAFAGIAEAVGGLVGAKAVVTNKPGPNARTLVEALGLGPLFQVVIGGGDLGAVRKPDPVVVKAVLERLPKCERVVLVGDSAIDAGTARAAGIGFVGVTWGLGRREEMEAQGARIFVDLPQQLAPACDLALRS